MENKKSFGLSKLSVLRVSGLVLALACYLWSCSQVADKQEKSAEQQRFRTVSELSQVMRELTDHTRTIGAALAKGELPAEDYREAFARIKVAEPTDDKTKGQYFEPMAEIFLQSLEQIYLDPSPENRIQHYQNLVQTCESCHQEQCPGPLGLIKDLKSIPTASKSVN